MNKIHSEKPLRRVLRLLCQDYPLNVAGVFLLSFFTIVLRGLSLGLILPFIEGLQNPISIIPEHPISKFFIHVFNSFHIPPSLSAIFLCGLSFFLLQAIFEYMRVVLVSKTAASIDQRMRTELFNYLIASKIEYYHHKKIGTLVNGLVLEIQRASNAFMYLFNGCVAYLLVAVNIIVAFFISWELSLIIFSTGFFLMFATRKRVKVREAGKAVSEANDRLNNQALECFSAFRELKIFNLENHFKNIFSKTSKNYADKNFNLKKINAKLVLIYEITSLLFLLALVVISVKFVQISISVLVALVAALLRLAPNITAAHNTRDKFIASFPGFEIVQKLLQESRENQAPTGSEIQPGHREPYLFNLIFKDVSFSYKNSQQWALHDVDLKIVAGKTTAIVGASGAGKSTLINLLIRFFDPTRGEIFIGDRNLKEFDLIHWRQMIGVVSQGTFLFNDSILNNIRYGNLEASQEEIKEAACRAHADEFIQRLPKGYDTLVGDRGVRLSGGQRQRLAFARAILRNPSLLILDEATSELDSKSEQFIQDSLNQIRKNHTVIIIAHRLSTVESADEIIVLDKGRVVERGTHQELINGGVYYPEYYHLQFGKTPS